MQFLTKKEEDERYSKHDRTLLHVANYLYNNQHSEKKSPHYVAILREINEIEPRFLDIASRFRPLANQSPALSRLSLSAKEKLVDLVGHYAEEIYQGSLPASQPQRKEYDLADFESEFQEPNQPLTDADRFLGRRMEEGETDPELSDGFTDAEIEALTDSHSTVTFRQISLKSIRDSLSPSPEFRENAVGLLIQFLQTNPASPQETNVEVSRAIIAAIKLMVPSAYPKLANLDPNDSKSLSKKELNGLCDIACLYRETLNQFQQQLGSVDNSTILAKKR